MVRVIIGNESMPIQLAQYWFPGLAISCKNISLKYIFQKNTRKQFYQTALGNFYGLKLPKCELQFKNSFIVLFIIIFGTLSFPMGDVR